MFSFLGFVCFPYDINKRPFGSIVGPVVFDKRQKFFSFDCHGNLNSTLN